MTHSADRDANQALRAVLDDVRGRYEQLKAGMDELQQKLAELQVTAESADGLVRATVGPRGHLVDLHINHRSYRTVDADELAYAIVATVRAAVADTTEQVRTLVGDHLPPDPDGPTLPPDGPTLRPTARPSRPTATATATAVTPDEYDRVVPPVPDPRDHREFDLPAGAYDVAADGWTHCDEQRLWSIADQWYAVAESADSAPTDAAEQAHRAAAEVASVLGGAAADAFADAWQAISVGAGPPPAVLREVGEAMGRLAERYGRDVEAAKLEAWIELGRLAIELLGDSLSAALALGGPEPIAAGHLAASRVSLHRLFRRLDTDLDRAAPAAVLREAGEARRQALERRQRDQVARHFLRAASQQHDLARDATAAAADARRDGLTDRAGQLELLAARAAAGHTELEQRAGAVSDGDPAPAPEGTAAGTSRAGGLRVPLPVHTAALDRALPRDAAGRIVRHADPRIGAWFALLNAGGPGTDSTRANNDTDAVLALYETYLFGQPRVASPRTFDGYAAGEPERPVGGEAGGCARIETTTGGRFQGLCPDVGSLSPRDARQAVEHAFTNLHNHLLNCGSGAFAVIAARTEAGGTHLWAAINHDGTVLHLDPQSSILVEGGTPYRHVGQEWSGNVVLLDALVVDRHGGYAPLPFHPVGAFGTAAVTGPAPPTGSGSGSRPVDPARVLLAEHAARLRHRVAPVVLDEVTALATEIGALTGVVVPVILRVRSAEAIIDEAERSAGNPRAGDVVDTVNVRLVVPDAPTLAVALNCTRLQFSDRIRAVRDGDTDRGTRVPPPPSAVHVVVSVRVDGRPYDVALRLVAERVVGVTARPSPPPGRRSHHATRVTTGSDVEEMLAEGVTVTDPAHLRYTHLFRYGEAYDDLRPAFVVDERGYDDAAQARAEVHAAEAALRQTGVIYEIEVSAAWHSPDVAGVPTWKEFRRRHFVDGVPLPVRPRPADRSVPPSWHAMNEEMDRVGESLCDELLRSNRAAVPGADTQVLHHRGPVRHGNASVYLHEERFGFVVAVETELQDVVPGDALTAAAQVYAESGWRLDTPIHDGRTVSRIGVRGLFQLRITAEAGFLTVRTASPLYRAPAAPHSTWSTEPRPDSEP